jgi:glycosyltransferase involved in cell wall biosynthesis
MPKVSVVMPVYNGEKYLTEAIESILGQTFQDFELIVADDGSTDKTVSIIKTFSDRRLIHLRLSHRGLVPTLNDGVRVARGEYIARMDADDIALPTRLAEQVSFLDAHRQVVVIGSHVATIDGDGRETGTYTYPPENSVDIKRYLRKGNAFIHPTTMFRKEAFLSVGGYRKYLHAEDYELWTRLLSKGEMVNSDHPLLRYRVHANSVTRKNRMRMRFTGIVVRVLAFFRTL